MKTGITFFAVIFFSFLSVAADQNCSGAGQGAQNSCITAADYAKKKSEEIIAPNYAVPKKQVDPPAAVAPTPKAAPIAAVPVTDLNTCLQKWDRKASQCLSSAQTAKRSCDQKNSESGIGDVQKYTQGIANSSVSQNAGKGSADECAKMSLLGNTAMNGMNVFKETCDDDFATCSSDCSEVIAASEGPVIANECLKYAITDAEQIEVVNTIQRIITASRSGRDICMVEAKAEKDIFEQLMATIGKSTQAAKVCACKFSSNSNGNCEAIPNPQNCLPGGASAGSAACNVFANDNCALGSPQFNSVPCQCARDNSAAVCRTAAAIAPSNFALDLKPNADGVAAGGAGVADSASGNLNLSGGYNVNKPVSELKTDDKDKALDSGYAGGRGGSGGAGGGSSAGGGGGDPAASVDEDGSTKTGLAGLFNMVKSSFGNNKSGSSTKNNKAAGYRGGNKASNYDLEKWRPRGPANANCQISQLRCKNEDIFLIMNKRYDVIGMSLIKTP